MSRADIVTKGRTQLLGVIGDEDTVTGFLLTGVGQSGAHGKNYYVVKKDTKASIIAQAFHNLANNPKIAILMINQHIANDIRHIINNFDRQTPTILEIPSKDHPYDPKKDFIMKRVMLKMGIRS
eukprot:g4864.t1